MKSEWTGEKMTDETYLWWNPDPHPQRFEMRATPKRVTEGCDFDATVYGDPEICAVSVWRHKAENLPDIIEVIRWHKDNYIGGFYLSDKDYKIFAEVYLPGMIAWAHEIAAKIGKSTDGEDE
jgi:hypothetical protein